MCYIYCHGYGCIHNVWDHTEFGNLSSPQPARLCKGWGANEVMNKQEMFMKVLWLFLLFIRHLTYHTLKTPGSDFTRKGPLDARPIFGSDPTRKPCQTDPESESERHFWLRFRVSSTQIQDQSDPEMGLAKCDPFRVESDPGVFRVHV